MFPVPQNCLCSPVPLILGICPLFPWKKCPGSPVPQNLWEGLYNDPSQDDHWWYLVIWQTELVSMSLYVPTALSRLTIIWRDKNISLASKVKLMRTLILSTFLYACESWTLTAEIERRIQALEMRCYRRLLNISYKDHVTNEEIRNRIQNAIGVHDDLLTMVKKRKLRWYGHISRSSGMAKTILQGTVKGARKRGRQKKRWEDNIKEWTGMGFGDPWGQRKTGKDGKVLLHRHL